LIEGCLAENTEDQNLLNARYLQIAGKGGSFFCILFKFFA